MTLWVFGAPQENHSMRKGTALDGGSDWDLLSPHAQIGSEYWVGVPVAANRSTKPLTLRKARITHVPKGLKILEYRVFSAEETDGFPTTISAHGKNGMPDLAKVHNYAGQPITLKPRADPEKYFAAYVRVTGPVHGALSKCRYWYRQGGTEYQQDLRCHVDIRLDRP
jgi:hypothetical protein